jgi:hypothetical protein
LPVRAAGSADGMSEEFSDPQLTGDDPMMGQIEALARRPKDDRTQAREGARPASPDPLEPGEPESARFEPDASQ